MKPDAGVTMARRVCGAFRDPAGAREGVGSAVPQFDRRAGIAALLAMPFLAWADTEAAVERDLRAGGVVIAFRHARAPGTFDPPGFRLGDCSTQRNLDDEGRRQARRIGQWLRSRGLQPREVLTSPWCRCIDTAALAFGGARVEPDLGSPWGDGIAASHAAAAVRRLSLAVAEAAARPGQFDAWVTHMFVLSDLTGENSASGEGLVLRAEGGSVRVLGRLAVS
jgi:hypothetical protein